MASKKNSGGARVDPRVERTRRALVQSCIELCGERGFDSLKVADITRRAGVNRTTFYLHYEDKSDLLQRGLAATLEDMAVYFEKRPAGVTEAEWLRERIERLFSLIEERRAFFRTLLSGSAGALPRERVERFLENFLLEQRIPAARHAGQPDLRILAARATVSALVGLASWWLEHPGSATMGEIADFYLRYAVGGMRGVGILKAPAAG